MAAGLLLYDLLYFALATALYAGALAAGARAWALCAGALAWPLAGLCAALAALLTLIALTGALTALCPRLRPGRYPMMKGPVFTGWLLRSLLRRVLFLPPLKWVIFCSNLLRFLALRALGAKVAFTASVSVDVDLLDPSLLTLGPGCTLGARTVIACHYVEAGELLLREVSVGEGALLALEVVVGPGVEIGPRAVIKTRAVLSVSVQVGEGADIGPEAGLGAFSKIGAGAVVPARAHLPPRTRLAAGAEWKQ